LAHNTWVHKLATLCIAEWCIFRNVCTVPRTCLWWLTNI